METETVYESFKPEDTFAIGEKLGRMATPGQLITLAGDLGAGKTVLAQGIANGLGVEEQVNSPTFTIAKVYERGRIPLYHLDAYRIGDVSEMEEIGYRDYFYGEGLCVIEWAELIGELLPSEHTEIVIEKDPEKGFDYRKIIVRETRGGT